MEAIEIAEVIDNVISDTVATGAQPGNIEAMADLNIGGNVNPKILRARHSQDHGAGQRDILLILVQCNCGVAIGLAIQNIGSPVKTRTFKSHLEYRGPDFQKSVQCTLVHGCVKVVLGQLVGIKPFALFSDFCYLST